MTPNIEYTAALPVLVDGQVDTQVRTMLESDWVVYIVNLLPNMISQYVPV